MDLGGEAIGNLGVGIARREAAVGKEADAVVFVREIGPYHVVEDVLLDGRYGGRVCHEQFGVRMIKSSSIHDKAGEMIEMCVSYEIGRHKVLEYVCGISMGRGVR